MTPVFPVLLCCLALLSSPATSQMVNFYGDTVVIAFDNLCEKWKNVLHSDQYYGAGYMTGEAIMDLLTRTRAYVRKTVPVQYRGSHEGVLAVHFAGDPPDQYYPTVGCFVFSLTLSLNNTYSFYGFSERIHYDPGRPTRVYGRNGRVTKATLHHSEGVPTKTAYYLSRIPHYLTATTRHLVRRYGLSRGELYTLSKALWTHEMNTQPYRCAQTSPWFRTFDATCNNLKYPYWGSAGSLFNRFIPPDYCDGISEPRCDNRQRDYGLPHGLQSARVISMNTHSSIHRPSKRVSLLSMQWGQIVDHDVTETPFHEEEPGEPLECCPFNEETLSDPRCFAIPVPVDDPVFQGEVECISLPRSLNTRHGIGPAEQMNQITAYVDGSQVYGSSIEHANRLRLHRHGLLKFKTGCVNLPNLPIDDGDEGLPCMDRSGKETQCVLGGDIRANEQPGLTAMHTLLLREHNRIATKFWHLNNINHGNWDDERIFQETRRIISAIIQCITFREWLPIILGENNLASFGLDIINNGDYYYGYDPYADATMHNAFSAAVFRFGHTLIQGTFTMPNGSRVMLRENFFNSEIVCRSKRDGGYEPTTFLLAFAMTAARERDETIDPQLLNHLFPEHGEFYGMDLPALNVQRARDHGVPRYREFRHFCGLPEVTKIADLAAYMRPIVVERLQNIYGADGIDRVDLFPAAMAEYPVPDGLLGPTASCLVGTQFGRLRQGDRFFYENGGMLHSFTPRQLSEIRRQTLAGLLCRNSFITRIQRNALLLENSYSNPIIPCDSIPDIDVSLFYTPEYKPGTVVT